MVICTLSALYVRTFPSGLCAEWAIALGGEPAVQSDLQRIATVDLFLTIEHGVDQFRIGGVAFKDDAIPDQIKGAAGQANLMAVMGLSAVLDDDSRMVFEDGKHLLAGRDAFTLNDAAKGLVVCVFRAKSP